MSFFLAGTNDEIEITLLPRDEWRRMKVSGLKLVSEEVGVTAWTVGFLRNVWFAIGLKRMEKL